MSLGVLLVEDDRELRATLRAALELEGWQVQAAASLADARAQLAHAAAMGGLDLVLLDLGLPDGDGDALLASLRQRSSAPVLLISARHGEQQKIALLDAGADDYLVKPITLDELAARLRALARRSSGRAESVWRHGALAYDPAGRNVQWQGEPVDLTARELALPQDGAELRGCRRGTHVGGGGHGGEIGRKADWCQAENPIPPFRCRWPLWSGRGPRNSAALPLAGLFRRVV